MPSPDDARGVWVYAVAQQVPAACLSQLTGVAGEPVRVIDGVGLAAVAGDVRLAEYGEAALRRNLEDLDWLGSTARAHHQVIDTVARQVPIVPMRLATVYRDDANVAAVLAERGRDFRTALERTGRRREWGVKVYAARSSDQEAETDPAPAEGGVAAEGSGAQYLRRKRKQLSARQDARQASLSSADAIHAELCRLSAGARLHPPQAPELTGSTAQMILNGAYLLDAGQGDELASAVRALAGQYPAVQIELTGPWPPYSFTGITTAEQA
jgi:hypothetical protein